MADDCEKHEDVAPHPHDGVAEVLPPSNHELPPEPVAASEEKPAAVSSLPGWPRVRFHPVFGRHEFCTPEDAAAVGQDDEKGDWRFKTAFEADMFRTDTEAGLAVAHNMRTKLAALDEQMPVARNSASAQESIDSGHAEPL